MTEKTFTDFASVRDALLDAQDRRGFLSYEQKMALQHAEWAASEGRSGVRTEPETWEAMRAALMEYEKLAEHPDIAAKICELMPLTGEDLRAILSTKRVAMEGSDIEAIVDLIKQHVL